MPPIITPLSAAIMGCVEGLTEFLPVSSTGHLILTARWLGLKDDAGVDAFTIVIQAGALLAVIGLYLKSVRAMALGVTGKDPRGLALAVQLVAAFIPAAVVGLAAKDWIKAHLFGNENNLWPVAGALAVGGVAMIVIEYWRIRRVGGRGAGAPEEAAKRGLPIEGMTLRAAFIIGLAQCLALWPGTSRSMVTIVAALLLGFSPRAAAEFSFLLALPTLGAATALDLLEHHKAILQVSGGLGLVIGFGVSFIVAWVAVKAFLSFLTRHGMAVFGWYRLAVAAVVAWVMIKGF